MITAQEYIKESLNNLNKKPDYIAKPEDENELVELIFKIVTSKKFRKYSLTSATIP